MAVPFESPRPTSDTSSTPGALEVVGEVRGSKIPPDQARTGRGYERTFAGCEGGLFTIEGAAVGRRVRQGHGNRGNADGAPRRRSGSVLAIVIYRQEVRPMYAGSAVGAPLQCTIARLR